MHFYNVPPGSTFRSMDPSWTLKSRSQREQRPEDDISAITILYYLNVSMQLPLLFPLCLLIDYFSANLYSPILEKHTWVGCTSRPVFLIAYQVLDDVLVRRFVHH